MLLFIGLLLLELFVLWLISRRLTQNLYTVAFLITRSREMSVGFLSFIFFPGTVIHELAHLFVAEILGVRTSGLTLVPEGLEKSDVQTGSVSIAQSDPIRRAIIGIAPIFVGLGALGLITYFLPPLWQQVFLNTQNRSLFTTYPLYALLGTLYALFAVSNTMFSSPEDMDGFWPVALGLTLIGVATYLIGFRVSLTEDVVARVTAFFTSAATTVGWITGLNIVLFFLSKLLIAGTEKVTGRRLLRR